MAMMLSRGGRCPANRSNVSPRPATIAASESTSVPSRSKRTARILPEAADEAIPARSMADSAPVHPGRRLRRDGSPEDCRVFADDVPSETSLQVPRMDVVNSAASIALLAGVTVPTVGPAPVGEEGFPEILPLEPPPPGGAAPTAEVVGEGEVAASEPNAQPQELDPNPETKARKTRRKFAFDPVVLAPLAVSQPCSDQPVVRTHLADSAESPDQPASNRAAPRRQQETVGEEPVPADPRVPLQMEVPATDPTGFPEGATGDNDQRLAAHRTVAASRKAGRPDARLDARTESDSAAQAVRSGSVRSEVDRRPAERPSETAPPATAANGGRIRGEVDASSSVRPATELISPAEPEGLRQVRSSAEAGGIGGRETQRRRQSPEIAEAANRTDRGTAEQARSNQPSGKEARVDARGDLRPKGAEKTTAGAMPSAPESDVPEGTSVTVLRAPVAAKAQSAPQVEPHGDVDPQAGLAQMAGERRTSTPATGHDPRPTDLDGRAKTVATRVEEPTVVAPSRSAKDEGAVDLDVAGQADSGDLGSVRSGSGVVARPGTGEGSPEAQVARTSAPRAERSPAGQRSDAMDPTAADSGAARAETAISEGRYSVRAGTRSSADGASEPAPEPAGPSRLRAPRTGGPQDGPEEQAAPSRAVPRVRQAPSTPLGTAQAGPNDRTAEARSVEPTAGSTADARATQLGRAPVATEVREVAEDGTIVAPRSAVDTRTEDDAEQPLSRTPQASAGPKRLWNWTKWSAVRDAALAQLEAADVVGHDGVRTIWSSTAVREPLLVAPTMLGANGAPDSRTHRSAAPSASASVAGERSPALDGRVVQASPTLATTTDGTRQVDADLTENPPSWPSTSPTSSALEPEAPATSEGTTEPARLSPDSEDRSEAQQPRTIQLKTPSGQATQPVAHGDSRSLGSGPGATVPNELRSTGLTAQQQQKAGGLLQDSLPTSDRSQVADPHASHTGTEIPQSASVAQGSPAARPVGQAPVGQQEGTQVVDGRTLRQLSDRVLLLATSRRKDPVVVRLEPRDLGVLTITVNQAENQVEATVAASNDHVRAALQQSAPVLQQSLEAKGLQLASLNIEAQSGGLGGFGDRAGQPNPGPQQQPLPFRLNQGPPSATQGEAALEAPSSQKAVDYRI